MSTTPKKRLLTDFSIILLATFLPRLLMMFFCAAPLRTPLDEMSTIATGAYAAGLDWSTAASFGGRYYGGGYSILFAPLWKLISDPVVIYQVMLAVSALLQSLVGLIAYHLLYKYMKVENRIFCVLAGVALSYMQIIRSMMVYNEHMLVLIVWVCILLLCRLIANTDNRRQRILDSVLLMLSLSYCLTLHTRSKALWIALVLVVIGYRIFFKRMILSLIPTIMAGGLGYFAAGKFIYWAKTSVWLWTEGEFLKNASISLNLSLDTLKSPIAWQAWMSTALSQIHISLIFTGGITAILLPAAIAYYWRCGRLSLGKSVSYLSCSENEHEVRPYILVTGVFSLLFIGAMIFAQSFTWLNQTIPALGSSPYNENPYGYKAFTYIRYYVICLGPFVLSGLALLYHCRELIKAHWGKILVLFLVLQTVFVCFILPHIGNAPVAASVYLPFGLALSDQVRTRVYLAGVLICSLSFFLMYAAYLRQKLLLPLLLLCLLMPYQYFYNGIMVDGTTSAQSDSRTDGGTRILNAYYTENPDGPHTVYMADMGNRPYTYQFLLPSIEIQPTLPEDLTAPGIVLAKSRKNKTLKSAGFLCANLDENEYLYVKGPELVQAFEGVGVTFLGDE